MGMKLAPRGFGAVASLVILAFSLAMGLDPISIVALASFASIIAVDLFSCVVWTRRSNGLSIDRDEIELRSYRGKEAHGAISIRSPVGGEVEPPEGVEVEPGEIEAGKSTVEIRIRTESVGLLHLSGFKISRRDHLGLVEAERDLGLSIDVRSLPMFVVGLYRLLRMLELHGRRGVQGDVAGLDIGRGLEYAWSRPYQPGDELSRMDWRTTAKTGKLYVKEHHRDIRPPMTVLLDSRAPGINSYDPLLIDLFETISYSISYSIPTYLVIHDGRRTLWEGTSGDPREAARAAVSHALSILEGEELPIDELLPPKYASEVRALASKVANPAARRMLEAAYRSRMTRYGWLYRKILRNQRGRGHELRYMAVPPYSDIQLALESYRAAMETGSAFTYIYSSRPWSDMPDPEEVEEVRRRFGSYLDLLRRLRVPSEPAGGRKA